MPRRTQVAPQPLIASSFGRKAWRKSTRGRVVLFLLFFLSPAAIVHHHTMAAMLRTFAKRAFTAAVAAPTTARAPYAHNALRAMATGPAASAKTIDDDLLEKLGSLSTQALIDGLWVMGWPTSHIMGARPLMEGQKKLVGRAITLQFAPARPDIAADKPGGTESPEYEAFELVNGKEVIVMQSVGPWESVGGDIKFLRLAQRNVSVLFETRGDDFFLFFFLRKWLDRVVLRFLRVMNHMHRWSILTRLLSLPSFPLVFLASAMYTTPARGRAGIAPCPLSTFFTFFFPLPP